MYRHILVPLDGSSLAEQVLPHVHALAANEGTARITLLRTVAPVFSTSVDYTGVLASSVADAMETLVQEARDYLAGVANEFRAEGYRVNMEVSALSPADAILDYAESEHADLIAIATHGRGGVGRFVFGSVTQKVIHAAPVPVLVIRPKEKPAK